MLRDKKDGCVMKAAVKPLCGIREIQFYEQLKVNNENKDLRILRDVRLVPKYYGTVKMPFRGKIIDFIKLEDITRDMREPCVIDIKIGKRTWDPFASADKIKAEEQKYSACKQKLGFCIPGFQVYDIKTNRIKRFGKDYGKKLDQETVKDGKLIQKQKKCDGLIKIVRYFVFFLFFQIILALKIFLNLDSGINRKLILDFLHSLLNIEAWAKSQTSLRLYSSSLLLVYDAFNLKHELLLQPNGHVHSAYNNLSGTLSSSSLDNRLLDENGIIQQQNGDKLSHIHEIPLNNHSTHNEYSSVRICFFFISFLTK